MVCAQNSPSSRIEKDSRRFRSLIVAMPVYSKALITGVFNLNHINWDVEACTGGIGMA